MNYGLYKSQCPTGGPYVTITRTPPAGLLLLPVLRCRRRRNEEQKKKRSTGVVDLQQEPEEWKRLS